jgi:hypothetical protein
MFVETTAMEKLPEVETARTLMTEAMRWSVVRWLREKKRVRKTADQANAALDRLSEEIQQRWADPLRAAYTALPARFSTARSHKAQASSAAAPDIVLVASQIKESDDAADGARMDAEETFDRAEKQLSTALAREGCRKAIYSWDLHEKAIRKAESFIRLK